MRFPTVSKWVKAGVFSAAVLSSASIAAAQSDTERAGARSAAEQGARAFNDGRYNEAIDLFTRAESLVHAPPHLLYMARAHEKLGELVQAREDYLKIGRETLPESAPEVFRRAQAQASAELAALEPRIPYLTVTVSDSSAKDVTVMVDGQPLPAALVGVEGPVNPGKHRLVAVVSGHEGQAREIELAEGVHAQVDLMLPPTEAIAAVPAEQAPAEQAAEPMTKGSKKGLRIGSYVAFGVGALGLGAGTLFLIKGAGKKSDADEAFDRCYPNCTTDEADHVHQLDKDSASAKTLSAVGFIAGGVGVATGITLFILSKDSASESSAAHVTPWIGWRSAGVSGRF
jgi:hypothetical protein